MSKSKDPESLRPVGARALKSAGDTLRPYLIGLRVLDLYAGQGRFGEMALVEGAASVTFVESHPRTAVALRPLTAKYAGRALVVQQSALPFLETTSQKYDLVMADPPFDLWKEGFEDQLLCAILRVLAPEALLLVKNPTRMVISGAFAGLSPWKQSRFGESTLTYFRYEAPSANDSHK